MSKIKRALPEDIDVTEESTAVIEAYEEFIDTISPLPVNMDSQKMCARCKVFKPLSNFNKDQSRTDGRHPYCKSCRKPLIKSWASRTRTKRNEISYKWEKLNKEKKLAHSAVRQALKRGTLYKEPCLYCSNFTDVEAHHPNYAQKLEVIWLCTKHHAELHSGALPMFKLWNLIEHGDCHAEGGESGCLHFSHDESLEP